MERARMPADAVLAAACLLIAVLVTMPVLEALRRRRASREASEVAAGLAELADRLRTAPRTPLDEALVARLRRLDMPEVITLEFIHSGGAAPSLLADTAQRLALRLRRRVAFERKMLARTAPGRRRGAFAAAAPGVTLLGLRMADVVLPLPAMAMLVAVEAFGCWLLWRVARVDV
jgi:hypothetical protein